MTNKRYVLFLLIVLMACGACKKSPEVVPDDPPSSGHTPASVSGESTLNLAGERPRFSPDGRFLAFHRGAEGARQLFILDTSTSEARQLADLPGDNRDPSWAPDGERLVFSSNKGGKYDLYLIHQDGTGLEQITDFAGDALQPAFSPLSYNFFAVYKDGCSPEADGYRVDAYDKLVFTRRYRESKRDAAPNEEIWFTSLTPTGVEPAYGQGDDFKASGHNAHQGRISPAGARCSAPAYSGDGLHLTWTCDDAGLVVHDAAASWDRHFDDAVEAIGRGVIEECRDIFIGESGWKACAEKLPRRYTGFEPRPLSSGDQGLRHPAYSTNHIVMIADKDGRPMYRERLSADETWSAFDIDAKDVRNVVWSPEGTTIAFDAQGEGGRGIMVQKTEFYLQDVHNLHQFPELSGAGRSEKLAENRFVVRPGEEREFYALYEKLRYQGRPQFVTADATLQVFRDEFMRILENAEKRSAAELMALSRALYDHYAARFAKTRDESDKYLAVYFAVPSLFLEAAAKAWEEQDDNDGWIMAPRNPILPLLPDTSRGLLENMTEELRGEISHILENAFAHESIGELAVPSRKEPTKIDWTQFSVRGNYAENELAGYFLAMSWYAQAPLPFDASLTELARTLESLNVFGRSALDVWSGIDSAVGSFMGKPVDATISHLMQARKEQPEIFEPFDTREATKALEELRGPMLIRDADSLFGPLENRAGEPILKVTFLPKRVGLDTTFFRKLTFPDAGPRPFPSSLDAMAVLGSARAYEHVTSAQDEAWAEIYRKALDELIAANRSAGYASTDIYHSWLALLATLARSHDVDDASLMAFAGSNAWKDRRLFSALAGYTQLKHSAVLYNAQDLSAECGGETNFYALVEQPILPRPRGFVDPMPIFFDGLAALAAEVYEKLDSNIDEPTVSWHWDEDPINVRILAMDLASIARQQLRGEALSRQQLILIEFIGGRFEALTLGLAGGDHINVQGTGRAQRGVLLATDIHTNAEREEVLQLGIGPVMNIFVAVPDGVAQAMTQGGIFSFYEFTHPMVDRLTDEKWFEMTGSEAAPSLPAWTASFVEER